MDQDLINHLDTRFDESARQTRQIVEETTRQIVEAATRQILQETTRQIEALDQKTADRFEKVDSEIRHTRVLIEDLRSDLKAVAEGVVNVNEKLDRHLERWERQRADDQAANRVVFSHHQERLDDHETRLTGLESARA